MELPANSEEWIKKYKEGTELDEEKFVHYWPLRRALQQEDWKAVGEFVRHNGPQVFTDTISDLSENFFHIIMRSDNDAAISFLRENARTFEESLLAEDARGLTVLLKAAFIGNKKAVEIIVNYFPDSPNAFGTFEVLPIHFAAMCGHEEIVQFLLPRTGLLIEETQNTFVLLVQCLIDSDLCGIALRVLKNQLRDFVLGPKEREWFLTTLAKKPKRFKSGSRLGFLQRLIYNWIPVKDDKMSSPQPEKADFQNPGSVDRDMENPKQISASGMRQKLNSMFWNALMQLAPCIKRIHDEKLNHMQALEIVRTMCGEVVWDYEKALKTLKQPILIAASLGVVEIVDEILKVYPNATFLVDEVGKNVMQLTVLHRHEKVFGIILKSFGKFVTQYVDNDDNNILHLAGKSAPSSKLVGSALQMQRELQWFKAVENLVWPSMREMQNKEGKTPIQVFVEEHKTLVKEGEKWMKETASSCIVASTLIITVAFAAAFTLPGGNTDDGIPIFLSKKSFKTFIIFDALALFSSSASLLMFLGIIASRYSEEDFLEYLPSNFVMGHITLLFSVVCMMAAFGAAMCMTLAHIWIPLFLPTAFVGCLTMILFSRLQFPLLIEMLLSIYGPTVF